MIVLPAARVMIILALIMSASIPTAISVMPPTKSTKETSRHRQERHRQGNS
jgi:hypothetical protein